MSDLISRQAAIQALDNAAEHWNIADPYHEGIRAGFRNSARLLLSFPSVQPTIDAVQVVRCKDCRFHEQEQPGMVYCPAVVGGWVDEDWFCKGGERRSE